MDCRVKPGNDDKPFRVPANTPISLFRKYAAFSPKTPRADQDPGEAHLARRPAPRHARTLRRRAGGDAGRGRASRLRADRHDQRHRALPPPHPLHAHPGLSSGRISPARRASRQIRLRILDARALLCADARFPLLPPRDEAPPRGAASLVRLGDAQQDCAASSRASAGTARSPSATSTTTSSSRRTHPWASRKPSKRALQLAFYGGILTISARTGMLKTYELTERHFGWETPPRAGERAPDHRIPARPRARARRASSASIRSASTTPRRKPAIRALIESRLRRKALVPVALEGAGKTEHWARPETLDAPPDAGRARSSTSSRPSTRCHPAQAAEALLRLRPHLRGLRAEGKAHASAISPCRCSSATRSSRRST